MLGNRTTNAVSRYRASDALERARAFATPIPPVAARQTCRALVVAATQPGAAGALVERDDLGFDSVSVVPRDAATETLLGSDPVPDRLLLLDGAETSTGLASAVAAMAAHLDASPRVASVGAALDRPDGTAVTTGIEILATGADRGLPVEPVAPLTHATGRVWPVVAASSACLLVRADQFLRVGGLDPTYPDRLCQDADLSLRFRRLGYDVHVIDAGPVTGPLPDRAAVAEATTFLRRWGAFLEASYL